MNVGKIIYKALSALVLIVMIALAMLLVGVRLIGFTPYTVLSPSMEPEYPVGSFVYIKTIDPQDITVGDDITFVLDASLTVVTHQVVEIDENHEFFTTKGIANDSNDGAPVYYENILGKVYFCVPYIGYAADIITSPIGLIISVALILMWAIIIYMVDLAKQPDQAPQPKHAKHAKAQPSTQPDPLQPTSEPAPTALAAQD